MSRKKRWTTSSLSPHGPLESKIRMSTSLSHGIQSYRTWIQLLLESRSSAALESCSGHAWITWMNIGSPPLVLIEKKCKTNTFAGVDMF